MKSVAILGLGTMGGGMARRLLAAGAPFPDPPRWKVHARRRLLTVVVVICASGGYRMPSGSCP